MNDESPKQEVQLTVPAAMSDEPVDLKELAHRIAEDCDLEFVEAQRVADLLATEGFVVAGSPRARRILSDAQTFAERTILAELVVRLFNFYVLGSIVLPDTPAAMDWLKGFVNGERHQGPLGQGPMLWPRMIPSAVRLLGQWGFEPTRSEPPYVIKRRGG